MFDNVVVQRVKMLLSHRPDLYVALKILVRKIWTAPKFY